MPVSVITDVVTWIEMIAQIGVNVTEVAVLSYLVFFGGWLDMIRMISFFLDNLIIKYIDRFYSYFEKLLSGRIFTPEVIDSVMSRVYVFVAVVVLIKILILFMKYVVNPEMVEDQKIGSQALVRRVIIGMVLLLFIPTIFDKSIDLQNAIISDNIFGKIFLSKSELRQYEKNKNQLGRILAFNVYQAFWSLDTKQTSSAYTTKYNEAVKNYDPKIFDNITKKENNEYVVDYFPIVSIVILFYVLYLIIKYCIDVVVRMFKLFLLELLSPFAVADYMINGDSKEMFKSWLKTTLSAYAMLFMRIFSIWFIAFVTMQMNKPCTDVVDGICQTSLLYTVGENDVDYLVRALVCIGLLAFLMDLPKLLSSIFGLDLEQDASVKGLMQKVGGAAKMVGLGAVSAGGAAVGGFIGSAKQTIGGAKNLYASKRSAQGKLDAKASSMDPKYASKLNEIKNNPGLSNRQKNKQMKDARKSWLKDNGNTEDAKEYKSSRRVARGEFASTVSAGAASPLTAGVKGLANSIPVVIDALSGYNQGQGYAQQKEESAKKTYEETRNIKQGYKHGEELATNEMKNDEILHTIRAVRDDLPTSEQINTMASNDAESKMNSASMSQGNNPVEMDAKVKNIDTSQIDGRRAVDVTADARRFDTFGIKNAPVDVDANVGKVDTSALEDQQINVIAKIEEEQFNENQDG